jgi:hypothetical protein
MNKLVRTASLGLFFAFAGTAFGATPAQSHPEPEKHFSTQTATIQTGVEVLANDDLCVISATWGAAPGAGVALPSLHNFQLKQACEYLARANLVEQTEAGWQPSLHALALYRSGPIAYANLLKKVASDAPKAL